MKNVLVAIILTMSLMAKDYTGTDRNDKMFLKNISKIAGFNHSFVYGLDGDDHIRSFAGNDHLTGGRGNDRLEGGRGNDQYHYNFGDGNDIIYDIAGHDTLMFGKGIKKKDIDYKFEGDDLIITISNKDNTTSTIKIIKYTKHNGTHLDHSYSQPNHTIEDIMLNGYRRLYFTPPDKSVELFAKSIMETIKAQDKSAFKHLAVPPKDELYQFLVVQLGYVELPKESYYTKLEDTILYSWVKIKERALQENIDLRDITFDEIKYDLRDKKGVKSGDVVITYKTSNNISVIIELQDCLKINEKWYLFDEMKWRY